MKQKVVHVLQILGVIASVAVIGLMMALPSNYVMNKISEIEWQTIVPKPTLPANQCLECLEDNGLNPRCINKCIQEVLIPGPRNFYYIQANF